MATETVVWRQSLSDGAGIAFAVAGPGPDVVWFEHHLNEHDRVIRQQLRFPYAALDRLLSTVDVPADGPAIDRLGGLLVSRSAGRPARTRMALVTLRGLLGRAGIPFESREPPMGVERSVTLHRPAHPVTGHTGEIVIRFVPQMIGVLPSVMVEEDYVRWGELHRGYMFSLAAGYEALGRLPVPAGSADDLCPGAAMVLGRHEVAFADAIRRLLAGDGTGGFGRPPGEIRDTVERWFAGAGVHVSTGGHDRHYTAVRAALPGTDEELFLHLVIGSRPASARVRFVERYQRPGDTRGGRTYQAETGAGVVDTLAAGLGAPDVGTLPASDRLFAWVRDLAAGGVIGPHLPPGANADLVAERFRAAGVPVTVERPEGEARPASPTQPSTSPGPAETWPDGSGSHDG